MTKELEREEGETDEQFEARRAAAEKEETATA